MKYIIIIILSFVLNFAYLAPIYCRYYKERVLPEKRWKAMQKIKENDWNKDHPISYAYKNTKDGCIRC